MNAPDEEDFKVNFRLQEERIATMRKEMESQNRGLYRESFEHDNCGIGAIVNIKGKKTHSTVAGALSIVEQLEHRAGKDAEGKTGDGVGILTQIPHGFFKKVCQPLGIKLKDERDYGVGMFFLPQDELKRNQAKKIFEVIVKKEGLKILLTTYSRRSKSIPFSYFAGRSINACIIHGMQSTAVFPRMSG